jgi:quinol monooxygenase YgiN
MSQSPQVYQLARYEVRPESLDRCLTAIHQFVAYVREHEAGTLRYDVWQERDHPTRFVHQFIFRDAAAEQTHSDSAEVKQFASVLYPECLAPVDFIDYQLVTSKT